MKRYWVVQCKPENYPVWDEILESWEWGRNNKDSHHARKGAIQCFDKMKEGDKVLCFISKKQVFIAILEITGKTPNNKYKEILHLTLDKTIYITLASIVQAIPNNLLQNDYEGYFPFTKNSARQGTFYAITKKQFELICELDEKQVLKQYERVFTTRHETGGQAEQIFRENYKKIEMFKNKELKDMRAKGSGYDFEISKDKERYFVEVKGIKDGGISRVLFTPKEWEVAKQKSKNYILVIVNLAQKTMQVVQNPSQAKESAKRSEITLYDVDIKPLCDEINLYKIKF